MFGDEGFAKVGVEGYESWCLEDARVLPMISRLGFGIGKLGCEVWGLGLRVRGEGLEFMLCKCGVR